jgi:hypothetical protein
MQKYHWTGCLAVLVVGRLYGILDYIHPRYMLDCIHARYRLWYVGLHTRSLLIAIATCWGWGGWRKMQIRLPHQEERGRSGKSEHTLYANHDWNVERYTVCMARECDTDE